MNRHSTIELRGLQLDIQLGTYGPGMVVPKAHLLDLTLWVNTDLVLIDKDVMDQVFDYDPLVADIDQLARDGHYETQERLISRIASACALYPQVEAAEIFVCKTPVLGGTGSLGVRLVVDGAMLARLRHAQQV